jgi:hypothetical protein
MLQVCKLSLTRL